MATTINPMDPKQLDLTAVVQASKQRLGWSDATANHAELWYRRFLTVTQQQSTKEGKIAAVFGIEEVSDEVWHDHILATAKYAKDTHDLFGGYLHHAPGTPSNWLQLLEQSEKLYLQAFGIAPPYAGVCCT
jgi:hypothetical protein